ncbi:MULTISPECIES: peptidoglycan-binding protein [unclassified Paenibacillus]|uniref:Peptidoglycan-binding protein n=1 Tax=Paenibacillus provencensis TaxID=441151 RepID=A0ABW3PXY0_9BACL|nr:MULTISPECIES: peptidoglycan-binding protein [unclassified Paenibacillus]MCM3127919.1 peptidoglycan-binding protein [Paenibacillus sp. MER 78]SFS36053.1 Peptidoglycan-binding (PGRP) domain of peptidoglycan hydrolases-containing protein [Paenibacillus sp. 453mf]
MSLRMNMVNTAISQVGTLEGANNNNKYGVWFGMNNVAWCAIFVSWCATNSGNMNFDGGRPLFARSASVREHRWFHEAFGEYLGKSEFIDYIGYDQKRIARATGCLIFFSGDSHIGIVERYDPSSGTVVTIEGNTYLPSKGQNYQGVFRRYRRMTDSNIVGFAIPYYENYETEYGGSEGSGASVKPQMPPYGNSGGAGSVAFPGSRYFYLGANNNYVTLLGKMLIHAGYGSYYQVGAGPRFTEADRNACAAFQRAQGWSGSDADGYPGPSTWSLLTAAYAGGAGTISWPPAFPGTSYFRAGASNAYVTQLGVQLVKAGYGRHYTVGPGPTWGEADRLNCQEFQQAQGWSGSDADGYPGPTTWQRLFEIVGSNPNVSAFPGTHFFGNGANNEYVTAMGKRLIAKGYEEYYVVGAGPKWSDADRNACAAFQRAQGWSGSDADGIPGPSTWSRLFA